LTGADSTVAGPKGDKGDTGTTGVGIATGGIAHQTLTKIDGTNFNTQWETINKTFVGLGNVPDLTFSGSNTGDNSANSLYSGLTTSKQDVLVSGTNIKTVNSTSLLGSGDVTVQPTLVSGTNIKTINGASILSSGDLILLASGGALGTPISGVATNLTGTAASLTAGHVTGATLTTALTNNGGAGTLAWPVGGATLTIPLGGGTLGTAAFTASTAYLASGGTATDSSKLGGTIAASYALLASPAFTTPSLGAATATTINGATITSGTLNGSVTGTNTGDNSANTTYASDYRAVNFIAGTNYLAPSGDAGTPSALIGTNISGTAASLTAGHVTGATFTKNLIVNTGNVTISGDAGGTSALTLGAGTVSVSGSNTGDNANTTGSAAKWTTARNLAGNSVDGSGNVAFSNKFIVQGTTDAGLSAAQFLGALGTGIVKNTVTTGILSIAANTDLPVGDATHSGAVPTPPNNTTQFLRGDMTWVAPSGGTGDMILANPQIITGAKTFGAAGNVGKLILAGNTSGTTILNAAATAGAGTVTLPTTGTLATTDQVESITGTKTFDSSDFRMLGTSSTGYTTLASANASAANYTIILPAANGTVIVTAPGTAGNLLQSDGTNWTSVAAGVLIGRQTLTTSGTYTPTTGTTDIMVRMVGGGGGGAGATGISSGCSAGGGGGSGAYAEKYYTVISGTYGYTIGAAGAAGTATGSGGAGGSTIFTGPTTVTAPGGSGGIYTLGAAAVKTFLGGAGGAIATGGDVMTLGQPGGYGVCLSGTVGVSGFGAPSHFGGGGNSINVAAVGNAAVANTGAGGGGAISLTTTGKAGGAGGTGVIVIWEYR